jgi:MFS family permease
VSSLVPQAVLPQPDELTLPMPDAGRGSAFGFLKVFRHRDYRLYYSGQLISVTGNWITNVAQGYLVYSLTSSPFLLGLVAFAGHAPVMLLSPLGGMIADRFERRRVLLLLQSLACAQSALLALLTLSGLIQVWHILVLALAQGLFSAFDIPVRHAMTMELVGRRDLRHAISLNSMLFNLARLIGPVIAGTLITLVGVGICFAIDAASYAAVLAGLSLMRPMPRPARKQTHPLHALRQGIAYAWRKQAIRHALLLIAACSAFGGSYITFMPALARDVLHQGSGGLGLLYGMVGAGAFTGAYVLTRIPDRFLRRTPILAALALGLSLIAFSQSRHFGLSLVLAFPAAFSLMLVGGATNSIVQLNAHNSMRGRVMGLYAMSFMGMAPSGALLLGFLAERIGTAATIGVGGVACLLAAATAWHATGHRLQLAPRHPSP